MDASVTGERAPQGHELVERLDALPLTRRHLAVAGLCAFALGFDLMEIAFGSALAAVFSAPPAPAAASELSWLLSSVYVGAIVGAPTMGWLADRRGRRQVLALLLVLLAMTSALAAVSPGIRELSVARMLSGVALGAFPPLMVVYLTDLLPAGRRAPVIFGVSALGFLGAPAGIFLIRALTPAPPLGVDGWRWAFGVGAAGALLLALAFVRWVPESPRWLLGRGREEPACAVLAALERSPQVLPGAAVAPPGPPATARAGAALAGPVGFALLAALQFLAAWSTVAFPLLGGALFIAKGYALSDTLLAVGVATFGPVAGNLLAAGLVDRVERRTALAALAAAMLGLGWLFVQGSSLPTLLFSSTALALLSSIYVPLLNVYGAESSVGRHRGGAVSAAWGVNRLGAALAPLVLLPLLRGSGPLAMYAVVAATLGLTLALLAVAPRGHARRPVA